MTTDAPAPAVPRPSRLAVILSAVILVAYFGFILLASLARTFMATVLFPGVSVGILLAAMVLVLCMALSSVFVIMANRDRAGA